MSDWVPFGLSDAELEDYSVLRTNLSHPAKQSVVAWILPDFHPNGQFFNAERVRSVQLATDIFLGAGSLGTLIQTSTVVKAINELSGIQILRLADYLLTLGGGARRSGDLETILTAARSKWTVGQRAGRLGLVERVPAGVQEFAESTMSSASGAGLVLSRAWAAIHGLDPQPSKAYADAVIAVEIVATAAVEPKNSSATLGSVISVMESQGDWRLPLREHGKAPSADLVIAMLRTLWFGHSDRHGKTDYSNVTADEARAAVSLAVVAVDWFASGALAHRPLDLN